MQISGSAVRMQRRRQRRRSGRIMVMVEVDEVALLNALTRPDRNGFRFLQTDDPDREQIAAALETVVALWIGET